MRAFTLASLGLLVAAGQAAQNPASNNLAARGDEANNMMAHVARDPKGGKGGGGGGGGGDEEDAASRSLVNGGLALGVTGIVVALGM